MRRPCAQPQTQTALSTDAKIRSGPCMQLDWTRLDAMKPVSRKISDILHERSESDGPFIAFEYYPPRTPAGVENLRKRLHRMKTQRPLYVDVTWGAGGSTSDLTLDLCVEAQNSIGITANMHLTCTNMEPAKLHKALEGAKEAGILNILALRGGASPALPARVAAASC